MVSRYDACVGIDEHEARLWIRGEEIPRFDSVKAIKFVSGLNGINMGLGKCLNEMGIKMKKASL